MSIKRPSLSGIWEKIRDIDMREKLDVGLKAFDEFIEGVEKEEREKAIGKTFTDPVLVSYFKEIPPLMKDNAENWLKSMTYGAIWNNTKLYALPLLEEVFDEQSVRVRNLGLPIEAEQILDLPKAMMGGKFLSAAKIQDFIASPENERELDMQQVKRLLLQSPKNINILMEQVGNFNNFEKVFEAHPQMLIHLKQEALEGEASLEARKVVATAIENNEKVRSVANFYLPFEIDPKTFEVKTAISQKDQVDNELKDLRAVGTNKAEVMNRIQSMSSAVTETSQVIRSRTIR